MTSRSSNNNVTNNGNEAAVEATRSQKARITSAPTAKSDISKTQEAIYLRSGADISGFKVKAIAMKMRRNIQRQKSFSSDASKGLKAGELSVQLSNGELTPRSAAKEHLTPTMSKMIALQSILMHPFSILLVCLPLGIVAALNEWGALWVFWLNILAMIPLAKILGDGTEELADSIGKDTISGLLNATLGNVVEMILTVQTLRKGLMDVVKATLLGSILSNLLLVLGTSFLLGGLSPSSQVIGQYHVIHTSFLTKQVSTQSDDDINSHPEASKALSKTRFGCMTLEKEQLFTVKGALVNMAMHLLSIMTVALPTVMGSYSGQDGKKELLVSRCGAIVITTSYIAYILFHLFTHKEMLLKDERNVQEDDTEGGDASLGTTGAVILMLVSTIMIGISSEFLVESMDEVVKDAKLPAQFIGVILLPFAGNACEHASAIRFAMIDRPGLTIGIAMGSSTQISLFVVPFAVITGWVLNKPMDLNFGVENLTILFLSTLVVLALVLDGRSNWLKGFLLCNSYIFIAMLYWFHHS